MRAALPDAASLMPSTLELLAAFVAIPSVRGDEAALQSMAQEIAEWMRTHLGADIIDAGRRATPPLVHARIDRGAGRRILLYNMYDVMPASSAGWSVDPFRGDITELLDMGRCYVARGAENNKGPLAGMLVAVEALLAADALDADIELLIEGEEESGSKALRRYLQDPATPVLPCGTALFPSFCEYGGGPPRLHFGTKGIAHGTLRVAGGAWGGPHRAIHSSNSPWIASPVWRLIKACSGLAACNGTLGQGALPPSMQKLLDRLAESFDEEAELRFRASETFAVARSRRERLEEVLTAISLNLANLATDPPDGAAVIPAAATARFDLRLPPGIAPEAALATLRGTLGADCAPAVEILLDDAYPGHCFPADDPAALALLRCYAAAGANAQVWPWAIGAAPAHAFAAVANSFLLGGLGRGGNAHGTDEFVTLDGLKRYLAFLLAWLPATAAALPRPASPVPE
jgi:cysteinylglycine-S-conjugate dipeptidase